jgi:glycosyltransferase involved in cell wall biosynthesis
MSLFDFVLECAIPHPVIVAGKNAACMGQACQTSKNATLFSIIVAVYNDWEMLKGCLQSLGQQKDSPGFEVIIVDDGSTENAPGFVRSDYGYPLTLIRQSNAGVAASRNRGIRDSLGRVLLFMDADCRLDTNCLAALSSMISQSPHHNYFQLKIVGDCSSLLGRAEELRLSNFQNHMLQPDGRIRYLNTAGFAIRRVSVDTETGLFDPVALRGEDTLLLAKLMQAGELPVFVPKATVEHCVPLSLMECLRKDLRSADLERGTYDTIASKGVRVRVTHRERLKLLFSMWKSAHQESIGRSAWFALVLRQGFKRMLSFGYQFRV